MRTFKLTAKTFAGLENVLASEINKIGGKNIKPGNRVVYYEGDLEMIYKSNYFLRTALRILKEIEFFQFKDVDQFYLYCKKVRWENIFNINQSFVINSTVSNSRDFRNSMFASLKVKDAIADYYRDKTGKRPNVDTKTPDIVINVHINKNNCTISLDSSGESLHKRNYKVIQGDAPLNEVLAAGMILLSGWDGTSDFVDPMCGSGTLPIEAAFIAQNIPAGRFRKNYAFQNWPDYNEELFDKVQQSSDRRDFKYKIYASDILKSNVLNAQTNARRSLVFNKIQFETTDFKDLNLDISENAVIIINPPYGERIKSSNLDGLYAMIGERLKHQFAGCTVWILSASSASLKQIALKTSQKLKLYNGSLECNYNKYRLFSGKLSQQ
ncbi:THUMP domain-containing class I SAM-dependent RNA methyltransferase [Maribellus maritimus]|uniref:THUMP domain-containing class I SAM-dependent RNA methyltransferase n=1 Tax=Maribellus maritimus TaxID=2870838 RepID=UPI001EEB512C|nr:class I SAM-dependent RNA methyltransferase [Maribellus maritimus]MCG6189399.1 class I SAM-dependent RNA methyltransferase [Maribellus maritimus]